MPFDEIRRRCSARNWSSAVQLASRGAVSLESQQGEELLFRVNIPGRPLAFSTSLYPSEREWSCDCNSKEDPCLHVTAAAIAWRQGDAVQDKKAPAHAQRLRYRFTSKQQKLRLERAITGPEGERPLRRSLLLDRRPADDKIATTAADLKVDRVLGRQNQALDPPRVNAILSALDGAPEVFLDGEPIEVCGEPLTRVAKLTAKREGFHLQLVDAPGVSAVFENGAAVADGQLRPYTDGELIAHDATRLRAGRTFSPEETTLLVGELLPALKRLITVEIATKKLPERAWLAPRAALELTSLGEQLKVTPIVIYGEPEAARIVDDRLHIRPGGKIPERDPTAERRAARLFSKLNLPPTGMLAGDQAIAFASRIREQFEGEIIGDGVQAFATRGPLQPVLGDSAAELLFSCDESAVSVDAAFRAWRSGQRYVRLDDGAGWAELPDRWLEAHADQLSALTDKTAKKSGTARVALLQLYQALDSPPPTDLEGLRPLLDGQLPSAGKIPGLTAELRHYQTAGVDWLCFLRDAQLGALLADDMGLGKTLQAICALEGPALVVAPTSVLPNWLDEISRFRPTLRATLYHGRGRQLDDDADVVVTSYALLRRDIDDISKQHWRVAVLDEAQAIKNPQSQVAQAAFKIDAAFRVVLSGTPVENRLDDLWSLFHYLNPGLLGGYSAFVSGIRDPIDQGDEAAAVRLKQLIRPFVLRRIKEEVAPELPERSDVTRYCELDERERGVYETVRAATRQDVVEALAQGGSVLPALEAILRLRQAACHPALLPGQTAESSSKVDLLMSLIDEVTSTQQRALVFSQWTSLLDLIEPHLKRAGVEFCRLDGTTRNRKAVIERFTDEDGPAVMLISLKAGGVGLNLTSADHVFLLDPWWNPTVEEQAAARAHRIGRTRPVLVHRLVTRDSIEQRVLALQARKRALSELALGEAQLAQSLTRDDILALLSDDAA
ncbi:MAG: helicase [Deltaproteobacteria bacterium]|nr:helicase [Deltaproteobacteria bacterium]